MVWGYIKSRETARRMDAYAGEVQAMHPFYAYDSPARANDLDLATTNAYALPGNISAGIQHGSWTSPVKKGRAAQPNFLNSNSQEVLEDLQYSNEDIKHIENWTKRMSNFSFCFSRFQAIDVMFTIIWNLDSLAHRSCGNNVALSWHMFYGPKERKFHCKAWRFG